MDGWMDGWIYIYVHDQITTFNHERDCQNVRTYDFSTLYTSIPHDKLKAQLAWVIKQAFNSSKKSHISIYKTGASWTDSPRKSTTHVDCKTVTQLVRWLIDNIYVTFGDKCFRQTIGIAMGTDCAPFLANLFLYSYEYQWIDKQRKLGQTELLNKFQSCCRYIDDLLLINNYDSMMEVMSEIYPKELVLVPDDCDGQSTPFLDLQIDIESKFHIISTSIFDKRDSFDFPIVNFPNLSGNIPRNSSYGVFVGELVRYARACTYLQDFKARTILLVKKLKSQYYTDKRLNITWKRFCDSHILLIQKYGRTVLDLPESWN